MGNITTLPLKDVKFNMCLAESVHSQSGELIFKANLYFTSREQLERLQDNGIKEVKINLDQSLLCDISPKEEKKKIIQVKKEQEDPEKIYKNVQEHIAEGKQVIQENQTFIQDMFETAKAKKSIPKKDVSDQADKMLQFLMKNPIVTTALLNLKVFDERTFVHSCNVAYMSVPLAIDLKHKPDALKSLAEGSILHDIGKSQLPSAYVNKAGKLTTEERKVIETHPKVGWSLLKNNKIDNPIVLDVVLHHHENYSGTGYPDKLKESELNKHTVMVSLSDYYDACIAERSYKKKMSPVEAIRFILNESNVKFDRRFIMHFIKIIGIYPVGSILELSDGRIATVISFSKQLPTQPIVKALFHKDYPNISIPEEIIPLIHNEDIYIVDFYDK